MPQYRVPINVEVTYYANVEADDPEAAIDAAYEDYPGLPYIGEDWEESGEAEHRKPEEVK